MPSLDPNDWSDLRALGHRMMDDMFDHLAGLRQQPVWRKMPDEIRACFEKPLPERGTDAQSLYRFFGEAIQPYVTGNTHPGFMGWVHGGGNAVSMLAEFLAGAMNANCGGRDHVGIALERQVIAWAAEMVGMPRGTSGVLLTGSSMANFVALLCARFQALGPAGRVAGIGDRRLTAYVGETAHRCIAGAMDMAGIGTANLRRIPVDAAYRVDVARLARAIEQDRAAARTPFLIIGTAGTVDTGAIDDLAALADTAAALGLWFHVDAAFGALAALSPRLRPRLAGLERADSIAFDFHKWAQVTYDAGCVLVRDQAVQLGAFAQQTHYLAAAPRGLAGGAPWPCDLGPDLSRGFRALKIWATLAAYGAETMAALVDQCCDLAALLARRIEASNRLELAAPVSLNIVCFRVRGLDDAALFSLVADLQESGAFAPSTTVLDGRAAIRAAIFNHRTTRADIDGLLDAVLQLADHPTGSASG
jgi:glutamate/tyrosine decarboxylase-like PLP-dependent enzyme